MSFVILFFAISINRQALPRNKTSSPSVFVLKPTRAIPELSRT
jgi:hypothetical protein